MRIIAIDHGSKHIGLAVSDPTGTIANPLAVIRHVSRSADVTAVAARAAGCGAELIVIGQSLDDDSRPTFEGRRAARFAAALRAQTDIPIVLWDEAFTTQEARSARIAMGVPRHKRAGHLDHLAAAVLLQSYLDVNPHSSIVNFQS